MLVLFAAAALAGAPPVVGGEPSETGAWPATGALYMGDLFLCTSVLVAPDVLLTAAHCFGSPHAAKHVLLDTVDHAGKGGTRVDVLEGWVHPDWVNTYDIAVFVLDGEASVPHQPLLLDCMVEDFLLEGAVASVVGFGATDEYARQTTTVLHEAPVPISDPACDRGEVGCNPDVAPVGELVAGGNGVDSCVGDSGGPLYLPTPRGAFVAGITSRAALPTSTPCGNGGIYVRADAVVDWIEEVTGKVLDRPECEGVNRTPRPEAAPLVVPQGGVGSTIVEPRDPNPDDVHTFEIVGHGGVNEVDIDSDGRLTYRSWRVSLIAPDVTVRVTDQEGAASELIVPVVLELPPAALEPGPRCQSAAGSGSWLAFGGVLLGLARRRRRHGLQAAPCRSSPSSCVDSPVASAGVRPSRT